jgi:hypothetical protein
MRTIKTIVAGAGALMLPSLSAQPADLNFDPVVVYVLQLYREVTEVSVVCDVKDAAGNWIQGVTPVQAANTPNPSSGPLDASKSFSGWLQTGLNFNNPADRANAKTFVCFLTACNGNCSGPPPGGVSHNLEIGDESESEWWHVKAGTVEISGPIWSVPQTQSLKTFEAFGFGR